MIFAGYLSTVVYPFVWITLWSAFLIFLVFMVLRLIFNYADPNPFGKVGRFGFRIRKLTERFVYPAARFLANFRVDVRLAPLVTIFIGLVLTYFASQIIGNTFFVIDGLTLGIAAGNLGQPLAGLRLQVRPGMTGLWQVSGRSLIPFRQRCELDVDYVRRWSIWLDFNILLKTIPVVLFNSGRAA